MQRKFYGGILKNIKNPNWKFSGGLAVKVEDSYETKQVEYTVEDLKQCLAQFNSHGYVTKMEITEYRKKVFDKELNLLQFEQEDVEILFSSTDLEELSTMSLENLLFVANKNKWDSQKIVNAIQNMGICNVDILRKFVESKTISSEEIIQLFETNTISVEDVRNLEDVLDLSNSINFSRLNEYYKQLKINPESEELLNKYNKFLSLYKEILLTEKSDEELEETYNTIMEKIVEEFEGEEYNQAIKDYYRAGIISLDVVAEWSNTNVITLLFNEGLISLEDMNILVREQKLPLDYLKNIYLNLIKKEDIEYDERLKLIRSGLIEEKYIFDLYRRNLIFEEDLRKLAEEGIIREDETQRIISSRTMEELEKNSAIKLKGLNNLTKNNAEREYTGRYYCSSEVRYRPTGKYIIHPDIRERFIRSLNAYKAEVDTDEESPFYNYEFYVIPERSGNYGPDSVVIAERYFEDKDTKTRFATNNATYFFKYRDLMVLGNLNKSDMIRERRNIVFTANHVIAKGDRKGSWAGSVITSLTKCMLSSDLRDYTRDNRGLIALQKLKDVYTISQIQLMLMLEKEIDRGDHICEIEEPIDNIRGKRNTGESSLEEPSDGGEER